MSTHYAMCKYDDANGSYIPLEVRPITDKLKKDDPLYQEGFQAGAASRDAEIAEFQRQIEENRVWWRKFNEKRDQLRAGLVAALAACKVKDTALNAMLERFGIMSDGCIKQASIALAIQPDDSALKAWIGEPVAWAREWEGDVSDSGSMIFAADDSEKDDNQNWFPLYPPKELK